MNSASKKIISTLTKFSKNLNIKDFFSLEFTTRIFRMIEMAKRGFEAEEEFLFMFSNPNDPKSLCSISIKVLPIFTYGFKSFLMILKDISRFVTISGIIVYNVRQNHHSIDQLEHIALSNFVKKTLLNEEDINFALDYFYKQGEVGCIME